MYALGNDRSDYAVALVRAARLLQAGTSLPSSTVLGCAEGGHTEVT